MKKFIPLFFAAAFCTLFFATSCNSSQTKLSYDVKNELCFDAKVDVSSEDAVWTYADKIVGHVDEASKNMNEIFSKKEVNVLDFGAKPHTEFKLDETTYLKNAHDLAEEVVLAKNNTKAIYSAICEVSKSGGGKVIVPAQKGDVFYTSAIHLEDNVNLVIEEGATLKFTSDTSLYQGDFMKEIYGGGVDEDGLTLTRFESVELMNYSPFIYAYGKKNIAISGKGTLDGSATKGDGKNAESYVWHNWRIKRTINGQENSESQDLPRTKVYSQGQQNVDVSKRKYGEASGNELSGADDGFLRPNFVQPYNCQNVIIKDVNVKASPMWEINPVLCDTVLVEGLNINSHLSNNDGCDPECTSNIVIRNNVFDVGDDCIAIKSGRNGDGLRVNRPSYNIVVVNNTFKDGHGGVTIGSEITSGVKNVFAKNNIMDSDQLEAAYRFKTNYIRGGNIQNIFYKDDKVKMVQPDKPVVLVDLNYDIKKEVSMMESFDVKYKAYIPSFSNVRIQNLKVNEDKISGKGGKYAFQLKGFSKDSIADSCTIEANVADCFVSDFIIKDSVFNNSAQAFDLEYVDGFELDNVSILGTTNDDKFKNCKNFTFDKCNFSESKVSKKILEAIENSNIIGCIFS